MTASVPTRVFPLESLLTSRGGSIYVAKFDFWGKIQKSGIRNSTTYRLPNSRKSNFATEPALLPGETARKRLGDPDVHG